MISLVESAPVLYKIGANRIVRLSRDLILKSGPSVLVSDAKTLRFVAAKTQIPVPRVHRAFQVDDKSQYFGTRGYIVIDYIDGEQLGDCWKQLSPEKQEDVVKQTVDIIAQLQDVVLEGAGPIGGGPCRGRFFTDYSAGPFKSGEEMEAWFNHKLAIC